MLFYLGTHIPGWLWNSEANVPLFVSARRLRTVKNLKKSTHQWALDSGGFSELSMYGEWRTSPEEYCREVRRYIDCVGLMDWAAVQDWMCEPHMLAKTGKTVREHQVLTLQSYETLLNLAPEVPWMPVLQGWEVQDYLEHLSMYRSRGHNITRFGIGSVCRRQSTDGIGTLIRSLRGQEVRLHAFGFKTKGLTDVGTHLESSDSLAWSFAARYDTPIEGHTHKNCANCLEYALRWRRRLIQRL